MEPPRTPRSERTAIGHRRPGAGVDSTPLVKYLPPQLLDPPSSPFYLARCIFSGFSLAKDDIDGLLEVLDRLEELRVSNPHPTGWIEFHETLLHGIPSRGQEDRSLSGDDIDALRLESSRTLDIFLHRLIKIAHYAVELRLTLPVRLSAFPSLPPTLQTVPSKNTEHDSSELDHSLDGER